MPTDHRVRLSELAVGVRPGLALLRRVSASIGSARCQVWVRSRYVRCVARRPLPTYLGCRPGPPRWLGKVGQSAAQCIKTAELSGMRNGSGVRAARRTLRGGRANTAAAAWITLVFRNGCAWARPCVRRLALAAIGLAAYRMGLLQPPGWRMTCKPPSAPCRRPRNDTAGFSPCRNGRGA